MSTRLLSKERVAAALRDLLDVSDQLLYEIVETVFNPDNEIAQDAKSPYCEPEMAGGEVIIWEEK